MQKLALFGYERPHGGIASMAFKLAGRHIEALQCAVLFVTSKLGSLYGRLQHVDGLVINFERY